MSKESSFTADLTRLLRKQGAIVAPYVASSYGVAGWPDRCIWSVLWCGHMELKTGERQCTPKQLHMLKELDRRRAWSAVEVREIPAFPEWLEVIRYRVIGERIRVGWRRDQLLRLLGTWPDLSKEGRRVEISVAESALDWSDLNG